MNTILWLLPLALLAWLLLRNRGASREALAALAGRQPQRVDVRTGAEFAAGHAEGSLNIPLDHLPRRLGELDKARPVVVACASGARSGMAADLLRQAGFEAVNAGPWPRLKELS
jgi:rhodanese-related sulfurtransferase